MSFEPTPNTIPPVADARATAKRKTKTVPEGPRDTTREIFETVVFVVVLVLMLKLFVAEAFVIPTGSMASTLYGDQVRCTCRECGWKFPINAMEDYRRVVPKSYVCENCGFSCLALDVKNDFDKSFWGSDPVSSGDRVLVSKYEYHLHDPHRFDVPVFKYPVAPYFEKEMSGMNYIKRLVGLGGETMAVFCGDLYVTRDLTYDHIPPGKRPKEENDAWQFRYMYSTDPVAKEYFKAGKFEIVRKTPDQIMAVRRIVFDLDHQPKNVEGVRRTRWHPVPQDAAGWAMEAAGFNHSGDQLGWMRYKHINPWREDVKAYWINDNLGYNHYDNPRRESYSQPFVDSPGDHWVSDLLVECTVEIASPDNEVIVELTKGPNRCEAIFAKGECKLVRYISKDDKEERVEMGSHATKMTKAGTYDVRLANFDSRLTVWVDKKPIPFNKEQSDYPPPSPMQKFEPTENDRSQPARVGAKGDVKISKVSLWRDLNYNCSWVRADRQPDRQNDLEPDRNDIPNCDIVQTYYVQPGHYLMFGDNSNSSADSRSWGLVPKRLMLGRAIMVYWPFSRLGVIE